MRQVKTITSGYIDQSFEERGDLGKLATPKSLIKKKTKINGRDNRGRISIRHRGGGPRRMLRVISSLDQFAGKTAKVLDLHYDPNRSGNIALIEIEGVKKYILAPEKIKVGAEISFKASGNIKVGDRAKLSAIPVGSMVYDIQVTPGSKSAFARSAGTFATLMAFETGYALVKLPSGELRRIHGSCLACLGQVSNIDHNKIRVGKAGRVRHMGIRPTVRGKAMHPAAHPHGGGEGVNPVGLKYPKTPWGKVAIGKKTRKNKPSDSFIVKRRTKRKR